jgi:hypothetical protein
MRHPLLLFIQHYAFRIIRGHCHQCKNPNDDLVDLLLISCTMLYDIENELGEKIFVTERQSRKAITSIWRQMKTTLFGF